MSFEIGGYRAAQPLGDDAGELWRAEPPDGGEPVALRVCGVTDRKALAAEFEIAGALRHPHLLAVLDVVESADRCALVTELPGAGSLRERLTAGRLNHGQTVTLLFGVAAALETCHQRGLVHGDISPATVLFSTEGRPLLAGTGRVSAVLAVGGIPEFSPCYASPEVARGGDPLPADDIFSLGSVALECLGGRPAWHAEDLRDVVIQSEFGQWPVVDAALTPALGDLVGAMLDPDPAVRPTAADILRRLADCGRPQPIALGTADLGRHAVRDEAIPTARVLQSDPPGPAVAQVPRQLPSRAGSKRARRRMARINVLRRSVVPALIIVLLAAGSVTAGLWWARSDEQDSPVLTAGEDWASIVRTLDEQRSEAFRTADPTLLTKVYAAGSAALTTDYGRIAALTAAGYRVDGLAHQIRSVEVVDELADPGPLLAVVDSLPAYPIRATDGTVVGETTAAPEVRRLISLTVVGAEYRIAGVAPDGR